MDVIFVPVICPECKRHSAAAYSKVDLARKLSIDAPIAVRCEYDGKTWDATARQRKLMLQLVREEEIVERAWGARRPAFTWASMDLSRGG